MLVDGVSVGGGRGSERGHGRCGVWEDVCVGVGAGGRGGGRVIALFYVRLKML